MQFQLTQRGLRILNNGKSFICKNGNVMASKQQAIICGDQTTKNFIDDHCTVFYLKPKLGNNLMARYQILMPFGEKEPKVKAV